MVKWIFLLLFFIAPVWGFDEECDVEKHLLFKSSEVTPSYHNDFFSVPRAGAKVGENIYCRNRYVGTVIQANELYFLFSNLSPSHDIFTLCNYSKLCQELLQHETLDILSKFIPSDRYQRLLNEVTQCQKTLTDTIFLQDSNAELRPDEKIVKELRKVVEETFDLTVLALSWVPFLKKGKANFFKKKLKKKVNKKSDITDNLDSDKIDEIIDRLVKKHAKSFRFLSTVTPITKDSYLEFSKEVIMAILWDKLQKVTPEHLEKLANDVLRELNLCIKDADLKHIPICMKKFSKTGPMRIGETVINYYLDHYFARPTKESFKLIKKESKVVYRNCIFKHSAGNNLIAPRNKIKVCIFEGLAKAFALTSKDGIANAFAKSLPLKNNKYDILAALNDGLNCPQGQLLSSAGKWGPYQYKLLSDMSVDDFKNNILTCIKSMKYAGGKKIVQKTIENHPEVVAIFKKKPGKLEKFKNDVVKLGYDLCFDELNRKVKNVTDIDPEECKGFIRHIATKEAIKFKVKDEIISVLGDNGENVAKQINNSIDICTKYAFEEYDDSKREKLLLPCFNENISVAASLIAPFTAQKELGGAEGDGRGEGIVLSNSLKTFIKKNAYTCFKDKTAEVVSTENYGDVIKDITNVCTQKVTYNITPLVLPVILKKHPELIKMFKEYPLNRFNEFIDKVVFLGYPACYQFQVKNGEKFNHETCKEYITHMVIKEAVKESAKIEFEKNLETGLAEKAVKDIFERIDNCSDSAFKQFNSNRREKLLIPCLNRNISLIASKISHIVAQEKLNNDEKLKKYKVILDQSQQKLVNEKSKSCFKEKTLRIKSLSQYGNKIEEIKNECTPEIIGALIPEILPSIIKEAAKEHLSNKELGQLSKERVDGFVKCLKDEGPATENIIKKCNVMTTGKVIHFIVERKIPKIIAAFYNDLPLQKKITQNSLESLKTCIEKAVEISDPSLCLFDEIVKLSQKISSYVLKELSPVMESTSNIHLNQKDCLANLTRPLIGINEFMVEINLCSKELKKNILKDIKSNYVNNSVFEDETSKLMNLLLYMGGTNRPKIVYKKLKTKLDSAQNGLEVACQYSFDLCTKALDQVVKDIGDLKKENPNASSVDIMNKFRSSEFIALIKRGSVAAALKSTLRKKLEGFIDVRETAVLRSIHKATSSDVVEKIFNDADKRRKKRFMEIIDNYIKEKDKEEVAKEHQEMRKIFNDFLPTEEKKYIEHFMKIFDNQFMIEGREKIIKDKEFRRILADLFLKNDEFADIILGGLVKAKGKMYGITFANWNNIKNKLEGKKALKFFKNYLLRPKLEMTYLTHKEFEERKKNLKNMIMKAAIPPPPWGK